MHDALRPVCCLELPADSELEARLDGHGSGEILETCCKCRYCQVQSEEDEGRGRWAREAVSTSFARIYPPDRGMTCISSFLAQNISLI